MPAMPNPLPFCREAGAGPGVVCLHSNASSSSQWRELLDTLAPRCHVLAPDSYGAGKGPMLLHALSLRMERGDKPPVEARAPLPPTFVNAGWGDVDA